MMDWNSWTKLKNVLIIDNSHVGKVEREAFLNKISNPMGGYVEWLAKACTIVRAGHIRDCGVEVIAG
jgi:hypothetical protein